MLSTLLLCGVMVSTAYSQTLILGGGDDSCAGTSLGGYCCDGSIINPSGDLFNNGDTSVDGVICCVGDPNHGVNNGGPSTCSAGSAIPLADAASATGSAIASSSNMASSVMAPASSSTSMDYPSTQRSSIMVIGGSSVAAGGQSGIATASATANLPSESSSAGSAGSPTAASSSGTTEQQSSNVAPARCVATLAPLLGGAMVGLAALL